MALLELVGLGPQLGVGQFLDVVGQGVDIVGHSLEALDHATFTEAQQLIQHSFVLYGSESLASPILGDEQAIRRSSSGQPDEPVVVSVPTVDHRRPFGLLVVEQEKVVADQLHLVERVVH